VSMAKIRKFLSGLFLFFLIIGGQAIKANAQKSGIKSESWGNKIGAIDYIARYKALNQFLKSANKSLNLKIRRKIIVEGIIDRNRLMNYCLKRHSQCIDLWTSALWKKRQDQEF
ncbi:MAG: hypothetical protein WCD44_04000, partial [Candidatus Babeliales bacterium]